MSLSLLVFVTVLILGIHFAEVGYLSLKATEASTSALWDATGMRAHRFTQEGSKFFNANQMRSGFPRRTAEQRANVAYRDFDGRGSTAGGAGQLTQVFTRARALEVSCRPEALAVVPGKLGNPSNILGVYEQARFGGKKVDGMGCTASSQLAGWKIPRSFMEKNGGGFFKAANYQNAGIGVCAYGRPRGAGGACEGRLSLALGDWGFAGNAGPGVRHGEWQECKPSDGCLNQPYWRAVETLYTAQGQAGGSDASALASMVTGGASPSNENQFHMVFRGEYNTDAPEMHHSLPSETGTEVWAVTPAVGPYQTAYNRREQCFLGMPCSGFF